MIWRCRDVAFDLSARTLVMGVLNVTPDSFSDGGRYLDPDAAIARGRELLAQGADLLDLGAESTRPGSAPVPAAEQLRRLEPVLAALASEPGAVLSVDTRSAEVAARALELGAHVVNDVSALGDPDMAAALAPSGAGLVLMHMRGTPATMQGDLRYDDVVAEVAAHLRRRMPAATARSGSRWTPASASASPPSRACACWPAPTTSPRWAAPCSSAPRARASSPGCSATPRPIAGSRPASPPPPSPPSSARASCASTTWPRPSAS